MKPLALYVFEMRHVKPQNGAALINSAWVLMKGVGLITYPGVFGLFYWMLS